MISSRFLPRMLVAVLFLIFTSLASASEYVTYLHPDVQGSPVVATDEQGQVIWRESYAPWGEREIKDSASANVALGSTAWYTGKEEEEDFGLYYYGARWYSPSIGQFYSIDPAPVTLDNPRSFGRYLYANNNPIRYTDPDGRSPIDVAFLAYDIGRLGWAVYSGVGVGAAAADVGMSIVGVLSPVPGTGQILKTARTADRVADAAEVGMKLKKAPTGKGAVPPSERDPVRRYSEKMKQEGLDDQGGACLACGKKIGIDEADGHHKERHADGGKTTKENLAVVCKTCHKKLHDGKK